MIDEKKVYVEHADRENSFHMTEAGEKEIIELLRDTRLAVVTGASFLRPNLKDERRGEANEKLVETAKRIKVISE